MRVVGVVTVARSDYGIYRPILRKLQVHPDVRLRLLVSGTHLATEFGLTVREIENDGVEIAERVDMLVSADTPEAIATSMGRGTIGFARAFQRHRPDLLLVVGDRFEMHAAVVASVPFTIPVAHIHGGETTEGAFDEALRHSITKMSHLHFTSTGLAAQRLIRMGEEPWRVVVSGAPALDNLHELSLPSVTVLSARLGVALDASPLIVTYHPVTLEPERVEKHARHLFAALETVRDRPIIFTYPNADTHNHVIISLIDGFVRTHPCARAVKSLGVADYFGLLRRAAAMVGNSSSGIIEAPSFELPVVNVGHRQLGRVRAANVIDVDDDPVAIAAGIARAVSPDFRASLRGMPNPYGDGRASERIVERLVAVPLDDRLLRKRFHDAG